MKTTRWSWVVLALGLTLITESGSSRAAPQSSNATLPFQLHSATGGVSLVTVMGSEYETFSNDLGGYATVNAKSPSVFGEQLLPRLSMYYRSYSIRRVESISMRQYDVLLGLAHMPATNYFLQPFFSVDVGMVYSWLDYGSANDTTTNARATLLVQFRPGFNVHLTEQFGVEFASPFQFAWNTERFMTFGGEVGILWKPGK